MQELSDRGIQVSQVAAIGITNQRETIVVWDAETGEPLYNAIVWNDTRTADLCDELTETLSEDDIRELHELSGLRIATYFSALKLMWLMRRRPDIREKLSNNTAMFGTIDVWLTWHLTGRKAYVTDVTNASRTLLMNINTCQWDPKLRKIFEVPETMKLPSIESSSQTYGVVEGTALHGVPINAILGDQHASLVGQGCLRTGEGKTTYGTGCFMVINTGKELILDGGNDKLLKTVAYQMGKDADVHYAIEGSVAAAGSAIDFLQHNLQLFGDVRETSGIAERLSSSGGVHVITGFSGLLAPHWERRVRGTILGMSPSTTSAHIIRATLESIAFQVNDVLQVAADMNSPVHEHRVDGGVSKNDFLLQFQADITGKPVYRSAQVESTALGVALAAGRVEGLYDLEECARAWRAKRTFEPRMSEGERTSIVNRWNVVLEQVIHAVRS